ncbi:sodium/proline symporter [Nocardioidaceae bacterium SCSIO 66511]|nr:sodium/proline symporter [Nocardioidaceae bacterium SCSIO 66511]
MDGTTQAATITFGIYFVVMLAMGLWCYRNNSEMSDFAIGGRRLGTFVATISAKATDSSSWVFLGLPGAFYVSGMTNLWMIVGLTIGFYLSWRLLAWRIREFTERGFDWRTGKRGDSVTVPAFLANRFHSDVLRIVSAAVILVFYVIYLGSGFVATGVMFSQVFDVSTATGVFVGAGVVMLYSCLGGFLASSYTDVVQGLLMFGSLAVVCVVAVTQAGGVGSVADSLADENGDLMSPFVEVDLVNGEWVTGNSVAIIAIVSGLAWGLGYFGQPTILARFMGLRSSKSVKSAGRLGLFMSITLLGFAGVIGLLAIVTFGPGLDNPENAYMELVATQLPAWTAGIFLAGILSAIMSTADSQLVVAASTLVEDFYRGFINRDASEWSLVWLSRITVVVATVIAAFIALGGGTVLDLVGYAWAGFAAALGPVLFAALYSRRTTWVGALCGMVAGASTVVIYAEIDTIGLYEMIPGFAAGIAGVWIGNRLGPAPRPEMVEQFDSLVRDDAADAEDAVPAA